MTTVNVLQLIDSLKNQPNNFPVSLVELLLLGRPPEQRKALSKAINIAAVPHWFDDNLILDLLDPSYLETFPDLLEALHKLPFVEPIKTRGANAFNIHESTRRSWRIRLQGTHSLEFVEISRAIINRLSNGNHDVPMAALRNELLYHQLVVLEPQAAASSCEMLGQAWSKTNSIDARQALAILLTELIEDGCISGIVQAKAVLEIAEARLPYQPLDLTEQQAQTVLRLIQSKTDEKTVARALRLQRYVIDSRSPDTGHFGNTASIHNESAPTVELEPNQPKVSVLTCFRTYIHELRLRLITTSPRMPWNLIYIASMACLCAYISLLTFDWFNGIRSKGSRSDHTWYEKGTSPPSSLAPFASLTNSLFEPDIFTGRFHASPIFSVYVDSSFENYALDRSEWAQNVDGFDARWFVHSANLALETEDNTDDSRNDLLVIGVESFFLEDGDLGQPTSRNRGHGSLVASIANQPLYAPSAGVSDFKNYSSNSVADSPQIAYSNSKPSRVFHSTFFPLSNGDSSRMSTNVASISEPPEFFDQSLRFSYLTLPSDWSGSGVFMDSGAAESVVYHFSFSYEGIDLGIYNGNASALLVLLGLGGLAAFSRRKR